MENLISPSNVGIAIQTIGAIIIAVITYRAAPVKVDTTSRLPDALLGGMSAAVTFAIIGLLFNIFTPKPGITISSPPTGQQIEVRLIDTGSGSFTVGGVSSRVFSDPDLRVYVLVHPADPPAAGWWIQQPATVEQSGQWSALAWIGSKDFPPHVGDKIEIVVVVTTPGQVAGFEKVSDPKDLEPAAQSDIVRISIGVIK